MIPLIRKHPLLFIIMLGLILRIIYAVWIYEPSLLSYHRGDYTLYEIGGSEILKGDLSFKHSLYLVRPPLFPLLVALLKLNPMLIITMNLVFGTFIILFTYLLAEKMDFSSKFSLSSAFVVAIDPTAIRFSGVLLAEPLANLLVLLFFIALWCFIKADKYHYRWALITAILLNLAALSRPSSYLLWIPATLCLLISPRKSWLAIIIFAITSIGGTSMWQYHNWVYFRNASYTTIGTYNLLYYRAASVEYQSSDASITEVYANLATQVEQAIGNDIESVTAETRHSHFAARSEVQKVMNSIAIGIFLDNPVIYILTIPLGMWRILITTRGFGLLTPIVIIWNSLFLLGSFLGIFALLRARKFCVSAFLFLLSSYYIVGTLLVQTSGIDTRARSMITPLMAIATVYYLQSYKPLDYVKRRMVVSNQAV